MIFLSLIFIKMSIEPKERRLVSSRINIITFFFQDKHFLLKHFQVKLLLLEYKEEKDKVLDFKEFTVR